ncbi:MAG: hypothetical protein ATN35_08305 [Epulopiscium sp. Nele67-Bin004]|nr:MAG: hypothetical protein ATN35_08305 [Epulopiscium sp. Nele67-Bin004]
MNKPYDSIVKGKLVISMVIYSVIVYFIGALLGGSLWWAVGLAIGTIFAIGKFRAIENSLKRAMHLSEAKATTYSQRQYFVRYGITAIVLLVAAMVSVETLIGIFFGLLGMKVGAYSELINVQK